MIMSMDNTPTPDVTPDAERRRRQKSRNWAMFALLAGFVVIVYAVTIVKIKMGYGP